ncbi:MAG: MSHA biogenesis protein MshJ [Gammaproteobacteria bacterium]|nr:MAG: MSHA biogenesis protein MshJ [Gammaproteobacteria bacterium]
MLESLKKIQERIDSRIIRERALIFVTIMAVIFMLWNFFQSTIDKKIDETRTQIEALATQRSAIQTQITATTQSLLNSPNKIKNEQILQLEEDIKKLESQLQNVSQNLIKADQLPLALQEVLQKADQLTLMEVNTLPAQELQFAPVDGSTAAEGENNAGVYQHIVELRVKGSYSEIVQLLISLERLPWRFYWQGLDYKVDKYPEADIKLRVYTLSSEEGLFGV